MATFSACDQPYEKDMARGIVKRLRLRRQTVARSTRSSDSLARLTDFARRLVAVPRSAIPEPASSSSRRRGVPVRMLARRKR